MATSNTHMHKGTSPPPKSVQQSELLVMDATSKTHKCTMHKGTSSPPKSVHSPKTATVTPAPVPARMSH
jgi:hypothetical protein